MGIAEIIELEKQVIQQEHELKLTQLREELELVGTGDMNWLKGFLGIKTVDTIKENVLYTFRDELEGDIVDYPPTKGSPWYINKPKFAEWHKENFGRINRRGSSV
ncbi:TPA: DUF771 domain-containing protein [Streptococcus suis]